MNPDSALAKHALFLIEQADVRATEPELRNALTVRAWLSELATGRLVTKAPEAPEKKEV